MMTVFLDESGDLGWLLDKPYMKGGSSNYITIAGIAVEKNDMKSLASLVNGFIFKHKLNLDNETKGSSIRNDEATLIVEDLVSQPLQIISITANKRNVNERLRRDKSIFYNYMLNNPLVDLLHQHNEIEIIVDERTIRAGSRNSFEDCLRAKCWGELQLNTNIACRYQESHKNPGIWLADWLSNFIWRHYERNMSDAYNQFSTSNHFQEHKLFM